VGTVEPRSMLQVVQSVKCAVDPDEVFQQSTIQALLEGCFDGTTTFGEVARHGDFGLGTFHSLQGEMIALDGGFYQARDGGVVNEVSPDQTTPFAVVKFFHPTLSKELKGDLNLSTVTDAVDALLEDKTDCYAVKIHGDFDKVEGRAIQPVTKPYPPLAQATQSEFSRQNVSGTMVGFRFPTDVQGLNVPGYHLHFISDDRTFGGHVFAISASCVTIEIDETAILHLALPSGIANPENLSEEQASALHKVEFQKRVAD
jgi:acetolactate decarboxylase